MKEDNVILIPLSRALGKKTAKEIVEASDRMAKAAVRVTNATLHDTYELRDSLNELQEATSAYFAIVRRLRH